MTFDLLTRFLLRLRDSAPRRPHCISADDIARVSRAV